jgi:hypothetical protein
MTSDATISRESRKSRIWKPSLDAGIKWGKIGCVSHRIVKWMILNRIVQTRARRDAMPRVHVPTWLRSCPGPFPGSLTIPSLFR